MSKLALVLAVVAIAEAAVTLHLVRQVRLERDNARALQTRVKELEQQAQAPRPGAILGVTPVQPAPVSPFTTAGGAQPAPPANEATATGAPASTSPIVGRSGLEVLTASAAAPDRERMREQLRASMERQRALLRDPEYREAMLAQQKLNIARSNPNLARDLGLSPEQANRLYETLANQAVRSMEDQTPFMWGEQPDQAKMQEFHRKMLEQQSANEAEIRQVLGDAKFGEWKEYQSLAGVRWEADRVRSSLANAGVPLDESLSKPLLKVLQEQQQKAFEQASVAARSGAFTANGAVAVQGAIVGNNGEVNAMRLQEQSVEMLAQHQRRQREALASLLTPEQLKVIEDEHNAELQMQRAQLRIMRAQQEAGVDPGANAIGFFREGVVAPAVSN